MFKYYGTEQNKRKYELLLETMGTLGVGWEGEALRDRELQHHPAVAALEGEFHRRWHQRGAAERHRQAGAGLAGLDLG